MKNSKGMTLIELIIGIAILSSIILVISAFYISGVKGFARETTTADNQFRVRRLSNAVGREVRRASTATVSSGRLKLTYQDGTELEYRLEANKVISDYYVKNAMGTLVLDETIVLTQGIKRLDVTSLSDEVNITIESLENSDGITYKLNSTINIRR